MPRDSARETFHVVHDSAKSNPLHRLVEAKDERALSRGRNSLAVRARAPAEEPVASVGARVEGSVLADRYHARILRTPREVRNALVYLLQNGRKHDSWRLARPDPYSSASSFDGWRGEVRGALADSALSSFASTSRCTWFDCTE